jgi:hypothetical protein
VPALCTLGRDTHPQVRQYALLALGKIGDQAALPTLHDAANQPGAPEYVLAAALTPLRRPVPWAKNRASGRPTHS